MFLKIYDMICGVHGTHIYMQLSFDICVLFCTIFVICMYMYTYLWFYNGV